MQIGPDLDRITIEPGKMGGRPCIRGLRITVAMVLGLIANGSSEHEIIADYPDLDAEDLHQSLMYAAWLASERSLQG